MDTKGYKAVPYTIETDWEDGTVWLNNHVTKEKMIITEADSKSIAMSFAMLEARRLGKI